MSGFTSKTTKTYTSGGGTKVVETRTYIDADGTKRTETSTYGEGEGGDFSGMGGNDFGDFGKGGMSSNFGRMQISGGQGRGGAREEPQKKGFARPQESRYRKGWGWKKEDKDAGSGGKPMKIEGKNYEEIRDECLSQGRLFEDPDFHASDENIFYSRSLPRRFEWKRPPAICDNPKLFVGGASRFDVKQGELGDCWLLAAVAALCGDEKLLHKVVPPDQSFTEKYAGIFRFWFWHYGSWKEVIVDDRLPTYCDKLVFMHSDDNNEFWTALLEKAYAKLFGSYESLKGGATSEAMEDFTGGVTEMYDFRQNVPANLFQIMIKAYDRNSLLGCSIEAQPGVTEAELSNGLICGHAYTITSCKLVDIQTSRSKGKIPLVRVRNPWGNEAEWKGAWSDKSQEWRFIPEDQREQMGLTFNDDGEFWMSFQDFQKNYQKIEICNLGPDSLTDEVLTERSKKRWEAVSHHGSWKKRVNAGGCRNYLDTFWTNPQYRVQVVDADDDDDENMGTLIVALMQKERRKKREEGLDLLTLGYAIYNLKDPSGGPLDMRFFKYNASAAKSPAFINLREVCGRHKLPPGHYVIIPTTFEPNQEGDFLLRIFSEKPNVSEEMDEETGMSDVKTPELTDDDAQSVEQMREAFRKVSGDDMEIDAYELKEILNAAFLKEFTFEGFSAETCRSMVAMMDADLSGKLGFEEFKKLWNDLRLWKSVFKAHDKDKSGNFNSYELRQAFHSAGFRVSNSTFNALVMRYSHRDGKIYFDDFIHCTVRMKTMFDIFAEQKTGGTKAEFSLDEFIQTTMYA